MYNLEHFFNVMDAPAYPGLGAKAAAWSVLLQPAAHMVRAASAETLVMSLVRVNMLNWNGGAPEARTAAAASAEI